jgi:hypothetical protein
MMRGQQHWISALIGVLVLSATTFGAEVDRLPATLLLSRASLRSPAVTCGLWNNSDTIKSYYSQIVAGERYATYLNPQRCVSSPQFPFEIRNVDLSLFTFTGANWPVEVAVEIWSAKGGDSCAGPGALLYTETRSLDKATYGVPYIGSVVLGQSVCVSGPFFVSIRFTGGSISPYPSVMFDSRMPADSCTNWGYGPTTFWDKWNYFWSGSIPGNLVIWVDGETGSSTCAATACCVVSTGNIDCDPSESVDISDLSRLIDYLYISFSPLCCAAEANTDGAPGIDISDLSRLIDNLFVSFQPLSQCQ